MSQPLSHHHLSLPERDHCVNAGCRCAAYVSAQADSTLHPNAVDPSDQCASCGHPWQSHTARQITNLADPHYLCQKVSSPDTNCGGFHVFAATWGPSSICICTAPWGHHTSITAASASPSQSQRTSASHNASSPSPMSLFQSLIAHRANAAATSNVQNQRMASARRNLPQHHGRGSAGTSLSLREQFQVSSEEQCMFAILPYVVKDGNNQYQMRGHASPEYSFAHDKLSDLLRILNKHHLGFFCSLPKAGQVWTHLDHFFQDHCNDHGHIVPDAPPRSSNEVISDDMDSATHFSMLKWLLLMPKHIQRGSVYRFKLASQIIWHSFTLDTLVKECGPKKLKNPLHDTWPLFILAPHYGNLRSDISEFFSPTDRLPVHTLPHACFAWRIMFGLTVSGIPQHGDPECLAGDVACPRAQSLPDSSIDESLSSAPADVPSYIPSRPEMLKKVTRWRNKVSDDAATAISSRTNSCTVQFRGDNLKAIAMTMLDYLYIGPFPISPLLIAAAILWANDKVQLDASIIEQLDSVTGNSLRAWFSLYSSDPLPSSLNMLVVEALNTQPHLFPRTRTSDEHDIYTRAIVGFVVFGHSGFARHPDFLAFRDGFDIKFKGKKSFIKTFPSSAAQVGRLLQTMYNRKLSDPRPVITGLRFLTSDYSKSTRLARMRDLFQFCLVRYLRAAGHPNHPKIRGALVSESDFQVSRDDNTLRARLFLLAISESDMVSASSTWKLQIRLHHPGEDAPMAVLEPPTSTEERAAHPEPTVHFHTCDAACDILVNDWLENVLVEHVSSVLDSTLAALFVGQLQNLHKACLLGNPMRIDGYNFAEVVGKARARCEIHFTKGAKETDVSDEDTAWNWVQELGLLEEELRRVVEQLRKDETKKMINAIERSFKKLISEPIDLLLNKASPDMWDSIRRTFKETLVKADTSYLTTAKDFDCMVEENAVTLASLRKRAWIALKLRACLEEHFRCDDAGVPRVWKPEDDIDGAFKKAKDQTLEVLERTVLSRGAFRRGGGEEVMSSCPRERKNSKGRGGEEVMSSSPGNERKETERGARE
ncbi:hypothetical protein EW146_g9322 [Bondarzewia mesenterica]|uniref:Sey1/RHD3-like three-helix bundle domain-containing protein n=1 Tax=Bondarzewia mesenterica TaxID=1095465 RepID=A0A4S4L7P5_9AGAM|nr:hypothetical protein EW146_g9322 [Bondarzewia mesenterica]